MKTEENVTLVVSAAVVERLLARQQLRVEDFRCGDRQAKLSVRRMLLSNLRQSLAAHAEQGEQSPLQSRPAKLRARTV